jgi:hypothetical protein
MNDFRDRFERQLVEAAERLLVTSPPRLARQPRRRRLPRRGALAVAATALLGGSALAAATHPWSPELGDPRYPRQQPTVGVDAPPAEQLRLLGVLRRPANVEDHGPSVRDALHYLGRSIEGVRTDYIRRLDHSGGAAVTLIPARRYRFMGRGAAVAEPLCVIAAEPNGDGGGHMCWTTSQVRHGRAVGALGVRIFGIVPDGVARVQVHFAHGPEDTALVGDNFFELSPPSGPGPGGSVVPRRWTWITWLDAQGRPVAKR